MQQGLGLDPILPEGAYEYGTRSDGGVHGLVLTRREYVELILDLVGYKADQALWRKSLLEPACGSGAFLIPAVERLITSAIRDNVPPASLSQAILTFDIDPEHVEVTRNSLVQVLLKHKVPLAVSQKLVSEWVRQGDFLLTRIDASFDVVIGNPPYIRIEQLVPELQAEYRGLFTTLYDRADLYVAFIEKGLHLLSPTGVLGFICADRWTLNKYGAPLRRLITTKFEVRSYIDLHHASPFESEVIAYPSIFTIGRERKGEPALFAAAGAEPPSDIYKAFLAASSGHAPNPTIPVAKIDGWFTGDNPWVLSSPEQLSALRRLEERFPLLEEDGATKVRIGVATGNDSVFIVRDDADIEPDRLVPLVMRSNLKNGTIQDGGRYVINAFLDGAGLINLEDYPRLSRYFHLHKDTLENRHVARNNRPGWFRTIDRVYPELVHKPKLLIPDIAGANEVVFDSGSYHPHHNLYYVVSDYWDLEVLGGLLSSRVALFFVWSYAVKMRGGYLRFQAQYLRRIRVPRPRSIPPSLAESIREAFRNRDFQQLDQLAMQAYGLSKLPEFNFVDTRH